MSNVLGTNITFKAQVGSDGSFLYIFQLTDDVARPFLSLQYRTMEATLRKQLAKVKHGVLEVRTSSYTSRPIEEVEANEHPEIRLHGTKAMRKDVDKSIDFARLDSIVRAVAAVMELA